MERSAHWLSILIRAFGGAALAIGLLLWPGYAQSLTWLHIGFGIALVFALWALAGLAWKKSARRGLAAFAVTWGLVTWLFGVAQTHVLPGSFHWMAEVAHLAIAVSAIAIGSRLAGAVASRQGASSTDVAFRGREKRA